MASLKNKKGDIEVTLLETKNIKSGDIFIIIDLPPNKPFKTHLFKGPDPKIFEKFVLDLMTFQDDEITLTVKEQKNGGSKFIGQIQIPIKALNLPQGPQWYYLTDRPLKDGQKAKIVTGSLQIQLSFIHRLIRARSRTSIPKEFFQPPTTDTNSPSPSSQQVIRNVSSSMISSPSMISSQNNYSTVTSNTSSNSTSTSSSPSSLTSSPTSQTNGNNIEVGFGYPVCISVGGNSSGSDILETQRGESINSRYLVPLVPIDDNQNHGSNNIGNNSSSINNYRTNNQNTEYSKEEDLIIEETIKDKESIVRKQISIQKDNLNKLNETIKQYEKLGKPVVSEKAKLKKMQEDIDDMERLIIVSKSTTSTTTSTTGTGQPIQKVPSKSRIATTKSMNKSSDKLPPISISTSTSQSNLILQQQQNCNNSNNGSNNLIHASIFNNGSNGISTTSYDVESKLKMFIVELENERRLKEGALESYNQLERETMSLKRELATTKTHTSIKSYDELFYRFKMLEAENQSLVQEKEILNEKYKLYEKESEKLEKELEYEQSLKRKETEKKEFEREESKKLLKELNQSQSKEKLISMELETQKELADIMREKKQLLERENLQLKQSIKQHQIPTSSTPTTVKSNQSIEQLQSKIKQLEIEIDFEKKSKSIVQDKLNLAERDQKLIDRLESEIKRLENQIVSLTNLNKSIEKEKSLVIDKFEKEVSILKSSNNNKMENTKNTLVNGTPKQIEEKLNEMVNILVGISQKPDSAAAASIANNKLFDTPLGKKIKDISDKIQCATLKNKEMELNLVELRNSKIQNQLDETAAVSMTSHGSKSNLLSSSSSSIHSSTTTPSISSLKNSIGSNNNSPSTSSNDLLMQQQNNQISILVSKLEKLDRLEEFIRKLDDMKQFQINQSSNNLLTGSSGGAPTAVKRNHLHMKSEMEEIQKIILNDKITDKERDDANVKFEKLFQELSMTEEYRKEIQQIQEDKRRLNEPLNQKSLLKMLPLLQTNAFKDRIKDNPELSLIGMDPKAIISKHQNDFQSFLLRCLPIDELRAIRASLPKFRSDQKKQIEWTLTLEEKIDHVSKLPNPPPNFKNQKPKLIIKTTKLLPTPPPLNKNGKSSSSLLQQPSGHQNLLGELLKKRSKIQ